MRYDHLVYSALLDPEETQLHHGYGEEVRLCEAMQNASPDALEIAVSAFNTRNTGRLSAHPLTNLKYLFVSCATLVTRFCIEGGLPPPLAYRISDLYIRALDACETQEDVFALHPHMIQEFWERMREVKGRRGASRHVADAAEYILKHLDGELTLEQVSRAVGVSPSRLSHLFAAELGEPFGAYVRRQRVEAAKDLLRCTDYPACVVASLAGFSSQSHMISVFKSVAGETPAQYRKKQPRIYGTSVKETGSHNV